ncbi:hypothetical protein P3X46_022600 [Hevea brasiliensis]|uniref:Retrotransposon Copia-like N-terminal domain-containing protein n=1 Tax=Hevea brasiliensis TaxID=3981 RepID=A0ABQ9L8E3_HEVBR|nr:hypothetical protein P3X46_022600 [Hevea brasiliensis]
MKFAIGAKNKLAFVDEKVEAPEEGSKDFEKWKRCDYMVTSWLLNSISKDLVKGFIYTISALALWEELAESYYTKLKQFWDELANIEVIPSCTCGSMKTAIDIYDKDKLMQFLMGLSDVYDQVWRQILLTDPLPSVNKAYSMVLGVETQREVQLNITEHIDAVKYDLKKGHCDYCNMDGHTVAGCFKLTGFPDWFKNRNRNTNQNSFQARYAA